MPSALSIRVRGIVGVGFCSFVYRLAHTHKLAGWVLNGEGGVQIFLEGENARLDAFLPDLRAQAPPAARISEIDTTNVEPKGFHGFTIRESERRDRPTVRISPDLPVCDECVTELFDPSNPRHQYPYINCTNCGPRYSVILSLPHDRCNTTMKSWLLDEYCSTEYHNPPVAASTLSPWPARSADQTLACARNSNPTSSAKPQFKKQPNSSAPAAFLTP
jgi:hydrogenase maturation protein HypF